MPQALTAPPTRRLPPGPRGLKLLRTSFTMGNDWSGFLSRCAREYGDVIYFRFLNVPICLVVHPDGIEKVSLRTKTISSRRATTAPSAPSSATACSPVKANSGRHSANSFSQPFATKTSSPTRK